MPVRAAWLPPTGQTRTDTRLAPVGTMTPTGATTTAPGVIPGGTPLMLTPTAPMQAQLDAGRAIVQGSALQGAYPVTLTLPETLAFAPGHAQWDRIDVVLLHVYDGLYDQSGKALAVVEILKGTPAADPKPAPLPACSLPLWAVRVPVAASAGTGGIPWATAVTDLRVYTVAAGGVRPDASSEPGAYVGQLRDTGTRVERWSGAAWVPYPSALGGIVPNTGPAFGSYVGQWRDGPNGLDRWDGAQWAPLGRWVPYTPFWSGLDVYGEVTAGGRYCRIGRHVDVVAWLAWGPGSSLGFGNIRVSLPVASADVGAPHGWQGTGRHVDAETYWRELIPVLDAGDGGAQVLAAASDGQWMNPGQLGYRWNREGASMRVQFSYETA
ncbi:hypothetical protein [Kitasatospora sp. A2-31]|uniref:hypothetical protein n=1 Tax=Kitasatospora sp. A2-31 TaxID=2916414 RepID=UPI001EEF543C|nr:hypothetical protein [Kitasatospora sp. A2-31]MCG6499185.1 hypothetical protein [Kitasatospora sp. A2-31]